MRSSGSHEHHDSYPGKLGRTMSAITETVSSVIGLLVEGEWDALSKITPDSALSTGDMSSALGLYGRTLVMPPPESFSHLDSVEVHGGLRPTLNIRFRLWTLEEGRSDLELDLTLIQVADGLWSARIDDLHVP